MQAGRSFRPGRSEPLRVYRRAKVPKAEPCGQEEIPPKYTAGFRERGVRPFHRQRPGYDSDNAAHKAIAPKPGCSPDALRAWCRQAERDAGERDGLTSEGTVRLKALERGNRELRQANGILRKASAYSAPHPGDCRGNHLPGGGSEPDRPFRKGLPSLKSIRGTLRSGRPAVCRRSPQPPVTPMRPSPGILIRRQTGPGRMRQA